MSTSARTRLPQTTVLSDVNTYLALKSMTSYVPTNTIYSLATVTARYEQLLAAQEAELLASNTLAAAKDATTAARREFHDVILGVKDQVKAQFGADSDQFAALGLKKKSEKKLPTRRAKMTG